MSTVFKIKQAIEEKIVSGELAPGVRLHENALQEVFQISRTPIREALLALSVEGFVKIKPRSGVYVNQLNSQELRDIFEVLAYAEGFCAFLVAQRIELSGIKELRSIQNEGLSAFLDKNVSKYNNYNKKFHEFLYQKTENAYLLGQIQSMRKRTAPYRTKHLTHFDRMNFSWSEHMEIVEAIEHGNPEQAKQAAIKHIVMGSQMFKELDSSYPKWFVFSTKDQNTKFDRGNFKKEYLVFPRPIYQQ